ncbi:MAG TPA: hypothetical protein PK971_06895 [Saprospiraceae bacterium]|nr:hypothetical protein [Saprospiraceae bacterium]HND88034.1 hypothetical protein [Saprospiraceae bacterium]
MKSLLPARPWFLGPVFALLLMLAEVRLACAQSEPPAPAAASSPPKQSVVLPPFDQATVWEAVRIKTETLFEEKDVTPRFKIKSDKKARRQLVEALEGQFQVNIADHEIRSLKRAEDLTTYLFAAQRGFTLFSKAQYQGKVERMSSDRNTCKEDGDCLNFIGSLIVPQGMVLQLYSRPDFKGDHLAIDATAEERRIDNLLSISYGNGVSTTNAAINWREQVYSVRIGPQEKK